jgi:hypothetical protein
MTTVDILNGLDYLYPENTMISQVKNTLTKFPDSEYAFSDALSLGQLQSKLWLIENLPCNLGTVFICAGWYGTLAALMFERAYNKFDKIRSFDIDPTCADIAENVNRLHVIDNWQFKASTMDIMDMEYPTVYTTYRSNCTSLELTEMPDTIINTSCEHIENFEQWYSNIPYDTLIVLQSNNYYEIAEHVNCINDINEFSKMAPMTNLLYSGELELPGYTRFMLIGTK